MKIFFPKEQDNEIRIAIVPSVVKKYVGMGAEVLIESGAGKSIDIDDIDFTNAGGIIVNNRLSALSDADIICRLNAPLVGDIGELKKDSIHISFLDPIKEKILVDAFVGASVTKQVKEVALEEDRDSDWREAVAGVKISIGPIALGGQLSGTQTGALHRAGEIEYIGNSSIGVALNVNDNLSISYGEARSIKSEAVSGSNLSSSNMDIPKGRMKGESYQIAYTLGGVGLKYANSEWDNTSYTIRGKKAAVKAQTVALTLAF